MKWLVIIFLILIPYSDILSQTIYCSKDSLTYGKNDYKTIDSVIIYNHDNIALRIDSIFTKGGYYKIQTQSNGIVKNWGSILTGSCPKNPISILPRDSIKLLIILMVPTRKISTLSSMTIDSLYIYNTSRNKPLLSLRVDIYIKMDIEKDQNYPTDFILLQNYPNPFNPVTTIKYFVHKAGIVSIKIYDLLGKELTTLINAYQSSGDYEIKFNGYSLSSGVYVYGIVTNNYAVYKKMILLK